MKLNIAQDYEPKTLKPGTYGFVITEATERESKAGTPMVEIVTKVNCPTWGELTVRDYIMGKGAAIWKTVQFCEAVGVNWQDGDLDPEALIGKEGTAHYVFEQREDGKRYLRPDSYVPLSS